jgi:hypothetical protein
MEAHMSVAEVDQEQELLAIIGEIDWANSRMVAELFQVLKDWWAEREESRPVMRVVCEKMAIDPVVFAIYRQCSALIAFMEPLRKGEPVRRVKVRLAMSEEARCWWVALLVVRVLLKAGGVIVHVRLLRWLGHQVDATQIRSALALLQEAGLLETYPVKGADPLRPVTWHRLTVVVEDTPIASTDSLPAATPS